MKSKWTDKYDDIDLERYQKISLRKWFDLDFTCLNCSNKKYFEGSKPYSRKCTKCKYDESVTAGTVFEHLRIPLGKAIDILTSMAHSVKLATNKSIELDKDASKFEHGKLSKYHLAFRLSAERLSKENRVSRKTIWYLLTRIMDAFEINDYKPLKEYKGPLIADDSVPFSSVMTRQVDNKMDALAVRQLEYIERMSSDKDEEKEQAGDDTTKKRKEDIITGNLDYTNFPSWYRGVRPQNRERYYLLYLLLGPWEYTNSLTLKEEDILIRRLINLTHQDPNWENEDEFSMLISSLKAEKEDKQRR